tara:strand:- start:6255 stop:7508 length:1254 start_codon:yes stop_codon:yes gene_type:complete
MNFLGLNIKFPTYSRNKNGEHIYDITSFNDWCDEYSNYQLGLKHAILSPALLFISKLYSQAEIKIQNSTTKVILKTHEHYSLIKKPNYNQTLSDLLETLMFTQIVNGVGVIWKKKTFGTEKINSLYVLDFELIEFPDEKMKKGKYPNASNESTRTSIKIIYDKNGENLDIPLSDLIFFYDMPNGMDRDNPYNAPSRIDGVRQELWNTKDSSLAKSIIIKSNGKEMISGQKAGFPFTPDEKIKVEENTNNNYGLGANRKRTLVTNASLKWQSMHIIMRDLGHDEGIKTDAGIILTALHLPRDVYSIDGAKSTYKNANQSLVSYIQNEMQSILESTLQTLNLHLFEGSNNEFIGSYNHLPVMLAFKTIKIENAKKQGEALTALRSAGISDEDAIELCGLPKGTILSELILPTSNQEQNE